MKVIDKNSKLPLYAQLMEIMIYEIENDLSENEKLLSEREICEKYNVSRTTVRQTLDQLEKDNYIYKLHGKGTFVSSRKLNQDLTSFYSFTEEMKKLGKTPTSDIIAFEVLEADSKLKKIFNCSENELFYKIVRTRKADNIAMIHEITYLQFERFKGLTKIELQNNPMYDILENKFKLKIDSAEEVFQPVSANKLESLYLDIEENSPSLKIERFTYEANLLIEYTVSIARGDKFKYKVSLKK